MENNRKTIFVVDDSISSLEKVKKILSDTYIVYTLNSGARLFSLLDKVMPDLILLDLLMPKMNGYEILEVLKNNKDSADIPVIFLTGFSNDEEELEGLSKGAVDYIIKPFSGPILLKRIELQLALAAQRSEQAAKIESERIKTKDRKEE